MLKEKKEKKKWEKDENMMKKFDKSFAAHEKRMCKYIYIGWNMIILGCEKGKRLLGLP